MIDWQQIDTILLDMDGTLLDLHFDNFFWQEYLPKRYAELHGVDYSLARQQLAERIGALRGTLKWYCLDHWSTALDVDIRALKEEVSHKIQLRPHVEAFLTRLREHDKQRLLVTNAHPLALSLKLDLTGLDRWLDQIISSHDLRQPKEAQAFWHALQEHSPFDPKRTLFVDDNLTVLQSAQTFGIEHLLCIHQPDSRTARMVDAYPAIHHFDEIMPPPVAIAPESAAKA